MNFNEYQVISRETATYPNIGNNVAYPALGLAGESGEVCEKVKKLIRDSNNVITDEIRDTISKELGDVLWYVAALASEFKLTLNAIAEGNIKKLQDRQNRGVLKGSGDNR